VCLLRHFIDVVVLADGFMDVQTYVLSGIEVVKYLSLDGILVLYNVVFLAVICRTSYLSG
jgi:hypothetical protein